MGNISYDVIPDVAAHQREGSEMTAIPSIENVQEHI